MKWTDSMNQWIRGMKTMRVERGGNWNVSQRLSKCERAFYGAWKFEPANMMNMIAESRTDSARAVPRTHETDNASVIHKVTNENMYACGGEQKTHKNNARPA